MSSSPTDFRAPLAEGIEVTDQALTVVLQDGRKVSVPLDWYPRLKHGTPEERGEWRLVANGEGIHWPRLDEDVSVSHLLEGIASGESTRSLAQWLSKRAARS